MCSLLLKYPFSGRSFLALSSKCLDNFGTSINATEASFPSSKDIGPLL